MEKSLPKGWVETELGNFAYLKNGYAYKTTQFKDSGIPILKISNITKDGKVDISNPQYVDESLINEAFLVKSGDIVIAMSGATTGKFGVYNSNELLLQNQRVGNIKLQNDALGSKKFLYYLIASLRKEIEDRAYGGAQPNISPTLIETIQIPLPPLAEQERIVAKLDKLFAQHEKIKKALDRIPQLLKTFRQQVLTQAVKSQKGTRKLKEFLTDIKYGTSKKSEYGINGTPILRIPNIENGRINDKDLKYSLLDEKEYDTLKLRKNDILIIRSNGSVSLVGQSAIITSEHENYSYAGYLIRIRLNTNYEAEYLNYIFKSNFIRSQMIDTSRSTSGVNNINSKEIQELNIPDIEIDEQQNILKRVESLFAKADVIETRYQALKAKIDNLPQAILHKAFRGELVPQLPNDGDAKDLLAAIMALKEDTKGKRGKA